MAEPTNNPGNIEDGGQAGRTGATYGDGRFPVFDSPQMGVRAMFRDLRTKMDRHEGDVSKIINQYAPRSENPATYEQYVLDQVGSTVTEDNLDDLVRAMVRFENKPKIAESYLSRPDIFEEGMRLSRIDLPSDASLEDARRMAEPEEDTGTLLSRLNESIRGLLDSGDDSRKLAPEDQAQFADLMSRLSQQGK